MRLYGARDGRCLAARDHSALRKPAASSPSSSIWPNPGFDGVDPASRPLRSPAATRGQPTRLAIQIRSPAVTWQGGDPSIRVLSLLGTVPLPQPGTDESGTEPYLDRQTSRSPGMEPRVIFGAFNDCLWYSALVFGGVSVVAAAIARRSWQQFQDALKVPLAWDNGDVPYQREWDFRYWHRMGRVTARLSILLSILWLIP